MVVGVAGAVAVAAGVASAEPVLDGHYMFYADGDHGTVTDKSGTHPSLVDPEVAEWTISPCGPGCAHVDSSSGKTFEYRLTNGRWETTGDLAYTLHCAEGAHDGPRFPSTWVQSFDAVTLTGTYTSTGTIDCGEGPELVTFHAPVRLIKH